MRLENIISVIEKIAPIELAQEWDNVGLLIGRENQEIEKIMVTLDLTPEVLNEAIINSVDMIITHHPVIFKPIKSINDIMYINLIKNDICVYSCHTNLDSAEKGVNESLAKILGLTNVSEDGMIKFGDIKAESFLNYQNMVKNKLNVSALRVVGKNDKIISKVAVLGGSGGDFISRVKELGCDLFVTGEASYHQAQLAESLDIALIAAGHFETENPVVKDLAQLLSDELEIEVLVSNETNPYIIK